MLEYVDKKVTFSEIPDRICLTYSIYGCTQNCDECHSPELWLGSNTPRKPLTIEVITTDLTSFRYCGCIVLLGGDEYSTISDLEILTHNIKLVHPDREIALYSGYNLHHLPKIIRKRLNYLKVGKYIKQLGGLQCKTTNQRLYKLNKGIIIEDLTSKFWSIK